MDAATDAAVLGAAQLAGPVALTGFVSGTLHITDFQEDTTDTGAAAAGVLEAVKLTATAGMDYVIDDASGSYLRIAKSTAGDAVNITGGEGSDTLHIRQDDAKGSFVADTASTIIGGDGADFIRNAKDMYAGDENGNDIITSGNTFFEYNWNANSEPTNCNVLEAFGTGQTMHLSTATDVVMIETGTEDDNDGAQFPAETFNVKDFTVGQDVLYFVINGADTNAATHVSTGLVANNKADAALIAQVAAEVAAGAFVLSKADGTLTINWEEFDDEDGLGWDGNKAADNSNAATEITFIGSGEKSAATIIKGISADYDDEDPNADDIATEHAKVIVQLMGYEVPAEDAGDGNA